MWVEVEFLRFASFEWCVSFLNHGGAVLGVVWCLPLDDWLWTRTGRGRKRFLVCVDKYNPLLSSVLSEQSYELSLITSERVIRLEKIHAEPLVDSVLSRGWPPNSRVLCPDSYGLAWSVPGRTAVVSRLSLSTALLTSSSCKALTSCQGTFPLNLDSKFPGLLSSVLVSCYWIINYLSLQSGGVDTWQSPVSHTAHLGLWFVIVFMLTSFKIILKTERFIFFGLIKA